MTDPIIEAAAQAIFPKAWEEADADSRVWYLATARSVLAAVTPLIRAAALKEAAKVAEEYPCSASSALPGTGDQIAAAIRAIKEQP
jgi:hypothetical protein